MKDILRKLHNLMLNCSTEIELEYYGLELCYQHPELKAEIRGLLKGAKVAAECSMIRIYYFEATDKGKRQNRDGTFYDVVAA